MLEPSLHAELEAIVGAAYLETRPEALRQWTENTLALPKSLLAVVSPENEAQAVDIVLFCARHRIAYYPLSTGKNWGYGGATPVLDDMLVLNLSRLNRIIEFNAELAYVVVEPGVTQQDLYEFMRARGHEFMVPTTGAGPQASLLGNALERGYGLTPHEDHFGSLLAIKAALADGRIYRSALSELGGECVDRLFKWKIGPYLDGLFTQGNMGVVLEGTIALAPKPENVTQFVVFLDDEDLERGVHAVKQLKLHLPAIVGGVNMMNKRRLLSMIDNQWIGEKALEEIRVIEYARKRELPDWAIVGALYGRNTLVQAGKKIIRKECRGFARKFVFLGRKKFEFATAILKWLPLDRLRLLLANAGRALEILEGTPSKVALPLAYLKSKNGLPAGELNPDRDNCGLMWFSPLIPLDPPIVRDYVQELTRICLAHDIDPLITLTAFSARCFDSTIPILYSREIEGDADKARRCYDELLKEGVLMGLFPYRLDIDHMHLLDDPGVPAFWMAQAIKKALDPHNLVAPGRYVNGRLA